MLLDSTGSQLGLVLEVDVMQRTHEYQWLTLGFDPQCILQVFLYHARRLLLEKLLYLELSIHGNSNGPFMPLLDPGGFRRG